MRFLLDENFPKSVISLLEGMGHEVGDFREVRSVGAPDQ